MRKVNFMHTIGDPAEPAVSEVWRSDDPGMEKPMFTDCFFSSLKPHTPTSHS